MKQKSVSPYETARNTMIVVANALASTLANCSEVEQDTILHSDIDEEWKRLKDCLLLLPTSVEIATQPDENTVYLGTQVLGTVHAIKGANNTQLYYAKSGQSTATGRTTREEAAADVAAMYAGRAAYVPVSVVPMTDGAALIARERQEQIVKHGFDVRHDEDYGNGELMQAAATSLALYAEGSMANVCVAGQIEEEKMWPWQSDFGMSFFEKIKAKSDVDKLKVAGALIAAEIDRLQGAPNPSPCTTCLGCTTEKGGERNG